MLREHLEIFFFNLIGTFAKCSENIFFLRYKLYTNNLSNTRFHLKFKRPLHAYFDYIIDISKL